MEQTEKLRTIGYSGIFLSCFSDYSEKCIHVTPERTLVYLFSGEHVIEDRNRKIMLQATFKWDFKKISTLSLQKWLINKRLEAAYIQLKESKKVQEVYVEAGFRNSSYFSTSFKKQYGILPTSVLGTK
jgi:hypothetical protein